PRKHITHVTREKVCLVYALMIRIPINVGVLIKNVLKRARVKKGQSFGFGGLLTRFLCGNDIEEEEADYRPFMILRELIVETEFEEPLDDDVAAEDEIARVDSIIESSDVEEDDSEMGEAAFAPTDDEE
ncbi:hypothetical protein HAX54_007290, partial [Datura stramonium]|nr:hypothetical protein [Datura stramonium]